MYTYYTVVSNFLGVSVVSAFAVSEVFVSTLGAFFDSSVFEDN